MRNLILFTVILCLCLATESTAQGLPRGLSDHEQELIRTGNLPDRIALPDHVLTSSSAVSTPRSIAEWEELQAIAITWTSYIDILTEIVRHAVREVDVIIITKNESSTRFTLNANGIDPDSNIVYINSDFNSVWIRDYGPNPAYTSAVDSLVLVDWIYNRPRPKDDIVPAVIAEYLGVPLLSTTAPPNDLVNTGGNYMADGLGRAFSSDLVLDENGPNNIWGISDHNEEDVDRIMAEFMGVEEYAKMTVLPYDGIHHIDMHMKILGENLLMMGEYPENIADGPQIEANLQYILENFKRVTGRDYEVVRMPMPPDQFGRYPHQGGYYRTYTNALFVNKTILVPTYAEQYDTTALRIWRETMPGYNIVGINCNAIIPAGGAIHCITKEIGVERPLWIWHDAPLKMEFVPEVEITATARHRDGMDRMLLYVSGDGEVFEDIPMSQGSGDQWSASVSGFNPGDTIYYYFEGTASDGKVVNRPLVAPEGYFHLEFEDESTRIAEPATDFEDTRVFPNPASAITCVDLVLDETRQANISIVGADGKYSVTIFSGVLPRGSSKKFFDAATLAPGLYYLKIEGSSGSSSIPFVRP